MLEGVVIHQLLAGRHVTQRKDAHAHLARRRVVPARRQSRPKRVRTRVSMGMCYFRCVHVHVLRPLCACACATSAACSIRQVSTPSVVVAAWARSGRHITAHAEGHAPSPRQPVPSRPLDHRPHPPLLRLAVGVAAAVEQPCHVALAPRVNVQACTGARGAVPWRLFSCRGQEAKMGLGQGLTGRASPAIAAHAGGSLLWPLSFRTRVVRRRPQSTPADNPPTHPPIHTTPP